MRRQCDVSRRRDLRSGTQASDDGPYLWYFPLGLIGMGERIVVVAVGTCSLHCALVSQIQGLTRGIGVDAKPTSEDMVVR